MTNLSINLLSLLTEQWRRWVILCVNGLLVLLLLAISVYQSNAIVTLIKTKSFTENSITHSAVTADDKSTKNNSIAQLHLFGLPENITTTSNTNTKWMLRGIILGSKAENNYAVIASSDEDESTYRSGDTLPDGTVISNIQSDQVLLMKNGTTESLLIPWNVENQSIMYSPNSLPLILGKPLTTMKEP